VLINNFKNIYLAPSKIDQIMYLLKLKSGNPFRFLLLFHDTTVSRNYFPEHKNYYRIFDVMFSHVCTYRKYDSKRLSFDIILAKINVISTLSGSESYALMFQILFSYI
jgi:hypothetical protein